MTVDSIKCGVNGVVGTAFRKGKRIVAFCPHGVVNGGCGLDRGACENQVHDESEDSSKKQ